MISIKEAIYRHMLSQKRGNDDQELRLISVTLLELEASLRSIKTLFQRSGDSAKRRVLVTLADYLSSIPRAHMVVHNHL